MHILQCLLRHRTGDRSGSNLNAHGWPCCAKASSFAKATEDKTEDRSEGAILRSSHPADQVCRLLHMAGWTRFELATFCVTGRRSNQLSYHPVWERRGTFSEGKRPVKVFHFALCGGDEIRATCDRMLNSISLVQRAGTRGPVSVGAGVRGHKSNAVSWG